MFVTVILADMVAVTVLEQKRCAFVGGEYFKFGSLKSVELHQFKKSVEKSILI